ncbi:hypothetical protein B0H19DRAFT_1266908 [Mycena capillaripes]|nr:hypothetical protein B0H19DRAFT_1266908 [Mycena capillaripes]
MSQGTFSETRSRYNLEIDQIVEIWQGSLMLHSSWRPEGPFRGIQNELVAVGRKDHAPRITLLKPITAVSSAVALYCFSLPSKMAAAAGWDQPIQSTSARRGPIPRTVIPVSDDWEDSDEEEPQNAEDNQRIWQNANTQAPMPSLIVSNSNNASAAAPPAAAFQPKMRILKRPTNPGPAVAPPPAAAGETLKEREARYQAARDRIFGTEGDGASSPGDKKSGQASPAGVGVVRNPRGPASEAQDTPPKGFGARSGNPPPSPNPLGDSEVAAQK